MSAETSLQADRPSIACREHRWSYNWESDQFRSPPTVHPNTARTE